jgi:purine-binding chemotaxis protein CheW
MNKRVSGGRRPVDWDAVRKKLALAEQSPAEAAGAALRILQERAIRLALATNAREAEQSFLEVLTFERAGRAYAIESRFVIGVGKCGNLSRVPGADRGLLGVTNLRGDILPVFDLAMVSGAGAERPLAALLVVLGAEVPDLGFIADSVEQVSRMLLSSLTNVSSVGSLPHPEYMRGITADACLLLDGDAVLRDRSVFVAKSASGSALERD